MSDGYEEEEKRKNLELTRHIAKVTQHYLDHRLSDGSCPTLIFLGESWAPDGPPTWDDNWYQYQIEEKTNEGPLL